MILKQDVLDAMKANRFDDPGEQPEVIAYMTGLVDVFFQGADTQDITTSRVGAAMLLRVANAFIAAIQAAEERN